MNKRVVLITSVVCLALVWSFTAFGQVPPAPMVIGPIGPNGFPLWIQDSNNVQLGLCNVSNGVDAAGEALGPCVLDPGVTNYYAADAAFESADLTERYLVAMSIAAVAEGRLRLLANEIVVRVRNQNGLKPGTYTAVTPYKTYTLTAVAGDKDIRIVDGGEIDLALAPTTADGPIAGNFLSTTVVTPGFIGTGEELVSYPLADPPGPGPNGGVFTVTDPDGIVVANVDQFSVQGRIFTPTPPDAVTIRSTTFNARRGILTVRVGSSVRPRPTFTATSTSGTVSVRGGVIRITGLASGFNSITVASSGGGTATVQVTIP